ncbi:MAG: phosphotransferase [Lentisphaerota bacterium]
MNSLHTLIRTLQSSAKWAALLPGPAEDAHFYIRRGNHKDLLFIFPAGCRRPTMVIKQPVAVEDASRLEREFHRLSLMKNRFAPPITGIPKVFDYLSFEGRNVLAMPCFEGRAMAAILAHPARRFSTPAWTAWLDRAAAWLLDFQGKTLCTHEGAASFVSHHLLSGMAPEFREKLFGRKFPACGQHGDFNPANILFHGESPLVLDWEWSEWPGLPLIDLYNLAIRSVMLRDQLGRQRGRMPLLRDAQAVLASTSPEYTFLRKWLPRFEQQLGMDRDTSTVLFHIVLEHMLTSSEDRKSAAGFTMEELS